MVCIEVISTLLSTSGSVRICLRKGPAFWTFVVGNWINWKKRWTWLWTYRLFTRVNKPVMLCWITDAIFVWFPRYGRRISWARCEMKPSFDAEFTWVYCCLKLWKFDSTCSRVKNVKNPFLRHCRHLQSSVLFLWRRDELRCNRYIRIYDCEGFLFGYVVSDES